MSFTFWQSTLLWLYAGVVLVWVIRYAVITWALGKIDFLDPDSPRFEGSEPPLITAIVPAKDEESTLEGCLESVARQSYPNLEILVVDDRSADRTPEIARAFAEADPRARILTLTELAPGWTGKTHALQVAAGEARGEWLWFLDADTRQAPDNLAIVLRYALDHDAAMASLLLELRCETFWEKVVQPLAGIVLIQSFPLFVVNDPNRKLAFANGQYILIRRDVYDAAGGHQAVRDRFVEDIAMAEKVKALGMPIRVAVARGIGSTRMYASLDQIV
ncbi:MAG: glycosyltransferase, partial [Isosphaeraceae bacterium]